MCVHLISRYVVMHVLWRFDSELLWRPISLSWSQSASNANQVGTWLTRDTNRVFRSGMCNSKKKSVNHTYMKSFKNIYDLIHLIHSNPLLSSENHGKEFGLTEWFNCIHKFCRLGAGHLLTVIYHRKLNVDQF